ncbi:MAG: thiamine diphosphokinase [Simkaniaceae bacterium]|nr:MAG: thiamine diphosphokinase [Simkaniaceae bacterium]
MIEEVIASHRSVICLDGGEFSEKVLTFINDSAVVIAADGAANWMGERGLKPQYIVGDGDSVSSGQACSDAEEIYNADQDTTDFEKCIQFVQERKLLPTLVLGFNGGEVDHVLGNAQVLLKHSEGVSLFFIDSYNKRGCAGIKIGLPLSEGSYRMTVQVDATVSILPFCLCRMTSKGLVWELTDQILTQNGLLAIRNRAAKEEIEFKICKGKALVVIDYVSD